MTTYTKINPSKFEVKEAIDVLNNNVDYVYDLMHKEDSVPSSDNIIPYSDFSIDTNLSYWKGVDNTSLLIQDKSLKLISSSNILGFVSPIFNAEVKSFQAYTLFLKSKSDNEGIYLNKAYILKEDDTQFPLKIYSKVNTGEYQVYKFVFDTTEVFKNARLVVISENIPSANSTNFKYTNSITNNDLFFNYEGMLKHYINLEEEQRQSTIYMRDNLAYQYLANNALFKVEGQDIRVADGSVSIFPSVYYPQFIEHNYSVNSILEQIYYTRIKQLLGQDITEDLNIIAYYYNKSKIVGAFPLLVNSKDYSILTSLYVLDILEDILKVDPNASMVDTVSNIIVSMSEARQNIRSFINSNLPNIQGSLLKGGFRYIESNNTYSLEWSYLNDDNKLTASSISTSFQILLAHKLSKLGHNCSSYVDKIYNSFKSLIPSFINERLEGTGAFTYSISPLVLAHLFYKEFKQGYKNNILNILSEYKQDNGLYRENYRSNNTIFSTNQYLEKLLDNDTIYDDYNISFSTIGIAQGNNVDINQDNNIMDAVKEEINKVQFQVGEESISAIVEKGFISRNYFEKELVSIYKAIEGVTVDIDINSIKLAVFNDEAFINLRDTANVTKELAELNKSKIEVLKDKINLSVSQSVIQNAIVTTQSIGSNLVDNSCFLYGNLDSWIASSQNYSFTTGALGKTYIHLETILDFKLSQDIGTNLYKGSYVVGLEALGRGSFTVNILKDSTVIATKVISPLSYSSRFFVPFTIDEISKIKLEITTNNINADISYLKLCRGTEDYGWSLSSNDTKYLLDNLSKAYLDTINLPDITIDMTGLVTALTSESNKLTSISNIILSHPSLSSSALFTSTTLALSQYIEAFTAYKTFLLSADKTEDLWDIKSEAYFNSLSKLVTLLCSVIDYISGFDVLVSDSSVMNSLKKEIGDVDKAVGNLDTTLREAFQDGILTSEEKSKVRAIIESLGREKVDLDSKVSYYTKQEAIKNNADVLLLGTYHNNFTTSYNDIVTLAESILTATEITPDMLYNFNSIYDTYKQHSKLLQDQLMVVGAVYTTTQYQYLIKDISDLVTDLNKKVGTLEDLVGDVSSDGILTTLEKRSIQTQFKEVTRSYLAIKSEIDYYQAQPKLADTTELTNLTSLESELDTKYSTLSTEVNNFLNLTIVTADDITRINGYIDSLNTTTEALKGALANCLIKLNSINTSNAISDVNTNVGNIQSSLDGLLDFTNEAWKDGLLTYTELVAQVEYVERLNKESVSWVERVDGLIANILLVNTTELANLKTAKTNFSTALTTLTNLINTVSTDGKLSPEEKAQVDTAVTNFYAKFNLLRSAISGAEDLINSKKAEEALNNSKKYIDDNYGDIRGVVDGMQDFTDTSWTDGLISKQEATTYKAMLDNLYKENLDLVKQITVYTTSSLTPELVGTTQLSDLIIYRNSYNTAYTNFYNAVDAIAKNTGLTIIDKNNYNTTKSAYNTALQNLRDKLIACTKKISEVQTNKALGFTDKEGQATTVVDWVKNADIELTKDKIMAYVEGNTNVLTTNTYLKDNYYNKTTVDQTYATKSSIEMLEESITNTVKRDELTNIKNEWLGSAEDFTKLYNVGTRNLFLNSNFWAELRSWQYNSYYVSLDTTLLKDGFNSVKISANSSTDLWTGISQYTIRESPIPVGTKIACSVWIYITNASTFGSDGKLGFEIQGIKVGETNTITLAGKQIQNSEISSYVGHWTKVEVLYTLTSAMDKIRFYPWVFRKGTINMTQFLCVEGDKTGDWTLAPEDYIGYTDNKQSGGRNLLVKYTSTPNSYLGANGGTTSSSDWSITDFIPVTAGKQVIASGYSNLGGGPATCFYNSSKVYVSGIANGNAITESTDETIKNDKRRLVTVPSGCSYMRFSYMTKDEDLIMLERGNTPSGDVVPSIEDTEYENQKKLDNMKLNTRNLVLGSDFYITTVTNKSLALASDFVSLWNKMIDERSKIVVSMEVTATNVLGDTTSQYKRLGWEFCVVNVDDTLSYYGVWVYCNPTTPANIELARLSKVYDGASLKKIKSFKSGGSYNQGIASGTFKIGRPQLLISDKDFDWSKAPEDIVKDISDVSGALSTLDQGVKNAFGDGIINDAEAKAIASNIQIVSNEKADIDKEYSTVYANTKLDGTYKTNLYNAKVAYDSANSSLVSGINTAISDKIITDSERNSVNSFFSTYRSKLADYKQRLQEALDYISTKKIADVEIGNVNLLKKTSAEYKTLTMQAWNVFDYYTNSLSYYGLKVGDIVTFRAYIKQTNGLDPVQVRINLYRADDTYLTRTGNSIAVSSEGYSIVTTEPIPSDITKIAFGYNRSGATGTGTFYNFQTKEEIAVVGNKIANYSANSDDLQIGTRNLIINGNFTGRNKRVNWNDWSSPAIREWVTVDKKTWCHIKGNNSMYQGVQQNTFSSHGVMLEPDTEYTLSFRAYGLSNSDALTVGFHWRNSITNTIVSQLWKSFTLNTTEQVYTLLLRTPANINSFNIMIGDNDTAKVNEFWFTDVMFTKGNKSGDYLNAPEDTDDKFTDVNTAMSEIKQTADKISLLVSNASVESGITITPALIQAISSSDIILQGQQIKITGDTVIDGLVTANSNFVIQTDGSVEASDITVSNAITAEIISANYLSVKWHDKCLTQDITVYINPSYAYDATLYPEGIDETYFDDETTYQSFDDLFSVCPRNLNGYTLTINMLATVTEFVDIYGFQAGRINILMNGKTINGYIRGESWCGLGVGLYGNTTSTNSATKGLIKPNIGAYFASYRYAVYFKGNINFFVYDIDLYKGKATDYANNCICASDGAKGYIGYCSAVNLPNSFVRLHSEAHVYVSSSNGLTVSTPFQSVSGAILIVNNTSTQCGRDGSTSYLYTANNAQIFADGVTYDKSSSTGSNDNTAPTVTTKTVTLKSSSGRSYRTSGSYAGSWSSDAIVRQGRWTTSLGSNTGCWFFGTSIKNILTNSSNTIKSIKVKVTRQSGGYSSGVSHWLRVHTNTSKPPGSPSLLSTSVLDKNFTLAVGSSITISLSSAEISRLVSNKACGFGIYTTSTSPSAYSCCSASLSVTISYTTTE